MNIYIMASSSLMQLHPIQAGGSCELRQQSSAAAAPDDLDYFKYFNAGNFHFVLFFSSSLFFVTQVVDEDAAHPTSLPARTRPTRLVLARLPGFLL